MALLEIEGNAQPLLLAAARAARVTVRFRGDRFSCDDLDALAEALALIAPGWTIDDGWRESGGARGRVIECRDGRVRYRTPRAVEEMERREVDAMLSRGPVILRETELFWAAKARSLDFCRVASRFDGNVFATRDGSALRIEARDVYGPGGWRAGFRRPLRFEAGPLPGAPSRKTITIFVEALLRCDPYWIGAETDARRLWGAKNVLAGLAGRRNGNFGATSVAVDAIEAARGYVPKIL